MICDIQKAVDDYYSDYTDYLPQIEVYAPTSSTKILNITYDNANNIYTVKLKVEPYVAAHNLIGEDIITFEISDSADVTVKEFKHLKSYDYPPWLNVRLKKPFPSDVA